MRCAVRELTDLEQWITDNMAERLGIPSPVLAATVYGGGDPIADLEKLRAAAGSAE